MKIVPLRKQYLFVMHSKTRRQDLIKSKHLKKYLLIVQQLERSGSQKQLVFQNTNNFLHNWQHHKQRKTTMHYTLDPLIDAFQMLQRRDPL